MGKFVAILTLAGFISALDTGQGKAGDWLFSAQSYQPIADRAALAVKSWDNSTENMELAKDIEQALKDRGFRIDKNAALVLSFEMRDTIGNYTPDERRTFVEVQGHGGRHGGEDASVMLNLYETNRGGVFNEGRQPGDVVPSKYQIELTVDRKGSGRHWQGLASANLTRSSGFELVKSMIPAIVGELGKTVKRRSITLK